MEPEPLKIDGPSGPGSFKTTQWNIVLAARNTDGDGGHQALAELCRLYWRPLYVYARRKGFDLEDAEDATQSFFSQLLERPALESVAPDKGRFRTFLLTVFQNYLTDEHRRRRAQKRGGDSIVLPLDMRSAEETYRNFEPVDSLTPEKAFMRNWVFALLEQTMARLRLDWAASGNEETFQELQPLLTGDSLAPSYRETAAKAGMSEGAVKVAVHRLRRRFAELLRDEIARTVDDPSAVEDEIKGLLEALS